MIVKVVWEQCEKVQHQQFVMVVVVAQLQVQEGFEVMLYHNILNIIWLIHNYAIDRILTTNH